MAMSLGLLVGIIAGAVSLTTLVVALMILGLRHKHRRLLSQINLAGERRLSGFPTGPDAIMNITDEDVARMPGTRASVHRSLHAPYNRNGLYTPMASRESLPRRAYIPKTRADDRDDHEPAVPPQQSWPLPRRLTRADGTPLVKMPSSTLNTMTERSKKALPSPPPKGTRNADGTLLKDLKMSNRSLEVNGKHGDVSKVSLGADLTPKPLFHGQQRSSSHGMIAELANGSKTEPRPLKRTSQVPRSKSMYSEEPGLAPLQPLPSLPLEITSKKLPRVKSPDQGTRRASGGSLFSEQTSILDDNWSKAFSQAQTDFTSITHATPPLSPKELGPYEGNHVVWGSSHKEGRASPIGAAKQMSFPPQLDTQRSFRASIQESLPRSKSSGLSLSMSLHGPSRAESRASMGKDPSSTHSKSRAAIPRSAEKRRLRGISPSSPLCRTTDFTIHDDTKSKRASTSILHAVSGNEGSPVSSPWDKRPRSIATSNPLEWDSESLPATKPSAPKDRTSGHQRQTCIRISNIPLVIRSPPKPPAIEEREELHQENTVTQNTIRETRRKLMTFRPPSRQNFDFALHSTLGLHRDDSRITDSNSPFSPTQFMMNSYREDDNGPDSEVDTPTRKPSSHRPSSTHPNRRKTIFDNPIPTVWPLPTPPTENHPDPEKSTHNISRLSTQSTDQESNPDSRPTSFLLNFSWPQPPKPAENPRGRDPKTPIRRIGGPRAPPFRYISPKRRRSPIKNGVGKRNASPVKDLRRSVAALRRMNSEVVSGGGRKSKEHKRYLSIGESESSAIFEDDSSSRPESMTFFSQAQTAGEHDGRLKADGKENLTGPREMPVFRGMAKLGPPSNGTNAFGKGPSGSMYDGDGFLQELDAWLH
ncbi:MAG: hypothetical protein ALECFALPRED_009674 [Alectoria fallacina]|uniref:Uncharacterized protein n=1 Tax=Alectoria fallacina TaxID=1903189 RepID=A0A8H3F2V6_9LECA|nr:MAG: hypothetical protein ALECFALPRED_009674 [Alectoria fallacina]